MTCWSDSDSNELGVAAGDPCRIFGARQPQNVVWINFIVGGKPQYADAGKILQPGSQVCYTGVNVKVTGGRAAATFITVDGHALGALGAGLATREFSSQTSP
jgi:hypothetical protein